MERKIYIATGTGRVLGAFTSLNVCAEAWKETYKLTGSIQFARSTTAVDALQVYLYPNEGGLLPNAEKGGKTLVGRVQEVDLSDKPYELEVLDG